MPKGMKADKQKADNTARQVAKAQAQLQKMHEKLADPNLEEDDRAEIEQAIADFQAKIDRLVGPAPTTPTA